MIRRNWSLSWVEVKALGGDMSLLTEMNFFLQMNQHLCELVVLVLEGKGPKINLITGHSFGTLLFFCCLYLKIAYLFLFGICAGKMVLLSNSWGGWCWGQFSRWLFHDCGYTIFLIYLTSLFFLPKFLVICCNRKIQLKLFCDMLQYGV